MVNRFARGMTLTPGDNYNLTYTLDISYFNNTAAILDNIINYIKNAEIVDVEVNELIFGQSIAFDLFTKLEQLQQIIEMKQMIRDLPEVEPPKELPWWKKLFR